jgi:argininosuccinate synthase
MIENKFNEHGLKADTKYFNFVTLRQQYEIGDIKIEWLHNTHSIIDACSLGIETPAGTIMLKAHRAMESLTLDREVTHLKDELMPRYATLIYNGYWWSPEREMLQTMIDQSQLVVNGTVRIKLYKGNIMIVGRESASNSLFDESIATFEDDKGAYNQKDAEGFIKLNALRMRIAARKGM